MRSGITLLEILIGILISLIAITAAVYFFSFSYKKLSLINQRSEGVTSVFQAIEIIDSDLQKAGYGVPKTIVPVEWDSSKKSLLIRYVDYTEKDCENEIFGDNSKPECDYQIVYQLSNNNIYRIVDVNADGTYAKAPMFFQKNVDIKDFESFIDLQKHVVSYYIVASINGNTLRLGDSVKCNNWK